MLKTRYKLLGLGCIAAGFVLVWTMFIWWSTFGLWWLLVFGLWVILLIAFEGHRRHSKLLVSWGAVAYGTVVDWKAVEHEDGEGGGYTTYEYAVDYNLPDGSTLTLREERSHTQFHKGQTLTVLYLQRSPERAMLYQRALHKAAISKGAFSSAQGK